MQHRKFLTPILAVLLVGAAIPLSIPKAHGDYSSNSLTISGFLSRGQSDAYLGSGNQYDTVQAGNTLTFNVFFTANSYYAQAAQSSLSTIGGGIDTATFTSIWVDSVAILLGGIGAILVGVAGFKYLRGKTRALATYTASAPKA